MVQHVYRADRFSLRCASVIRMLDTLKWPTFESQCNVAKILMFYKIINEHECVEFHDHYFVP